MILFLGDLTGTRGEATPDMRIQAGAMILGNMIHIETAIADREGGMDKPQHLRGGDPHHIGAEPARAVPFQTAHDLHLRERLGRINAQERIKFVVF